MSKHFATVGTKTSHRTAVSSNIFLTLAKEINQRLCLLAVQQKKQTKLHVSTPALTVYAKLS